MLEELRLGVFWLSQKPSCCLRPPDGLGLQQSRLVGRLQLRQKGIEVIFVSIVTQLRQPARMQQINNVLVLVNNNRLSKVGPLHDWG